MAKFKKNESLNNLSASLENYLETIAIVKREKKYARIGAIAKALNVKSSSVNIAMKLLVENNLVVHEKYGHVDLTPQGEALALEVKEKHNILYNFLSKLLFVNDEIADQEACEIEHSISIETVHKIERLHLLLKKYFLKNDEDTLNLKKYLEEMNTIEKL
ncbi:MAG: metal-dependent transcriptional regulator [Endomicrobium sp.]|jgi:DtxR family Mn-dependent transcriptional regulator|nr:metal-dependent transcriptional regulator [Endomicrobium sp.]